jgi:hypothetical protein
MIELIYNYNLKKMSFRFDKCISPTNLSSKKAGKCKANSPADDLSITFTERTTVHQGSMKIERQNSIKSDQSIFKTQKQDKTIIDEEEQDLKFIYYLTERLDTEMPVKALDFEN